MVIGPIAFQPVAPRPLYTPTSARYIKRNQRLEKELVDKLQKQINQYLK